MLCVAHIAYSAWFSNSQIPAEWIQLLLYITAGRVVHSTVVMHDIKIVYVVLNFRERKQIIVINLLPVLNGKHIAV